MNWHVTGPSAPTSRQCQVNRIPTRNCLEYAEVRSNTSTHRMPVLMSSQRLANATSHAMSRRTFLRGAGVALALPLLDAMPRPGCRVAAAIPRRMVAIETNMGILPQFFFPEKAGADYEPTPYLEQLAAHRANMTVFSGVSQPGVTGGHAAEKCFLTGTPHPERGGFRNWVSLDQFAAEQIGNRTRYPSLVLAMTQRRARRSATPAAARRSPPRRSPKKLFQTAVRAGQAGGGRRERRGAAPGPQHARLRRRSVASG